MSDSLLITVRFIDGRYHGSGDWPPSPARLFQALLAGAADGATLDDTAQQALAWLEQQNAPLMVAPPHRKGGHYTNFVPNNDLDSTLPKKGGLGDWDPKTAVSDIRAGKTIQPQLFEQDSAFLYVWQVRQAHLPGSPTAGSANSPTAGSAGSPTATSGDQDNAESRQYADTICAIANGLYQLGRGVDMAWAVAEVLDADKVQQRIDTMRAKGGVVHHPALRAAQGNRLACPTSGSLPSLLCRYQAARKRFAIHVPSDPKMALQALPGVGTDSAASLVDFFAEDRNRKVVDDLLAVGVHIKDERPPSPSLPNKMRNKFGDTFTQPPKPRVKQIYYSSPPTRKLYDLRHRATAKDTTFQAIPLTQIARLVEIVRDQAKSRLTSALPDKKSIIERVFGCVKEMSEADKASRLRITPLPSIGHDHAESSIRRVLVEIPANCPLRSDDIDWAFSGLRFGLDAATNVQHDEVSHASGNKSDENKNDVILVASHDWKMPGHYGIEQHPSEQTDGYFYWRSWTPVALPHSAARRRIDPKRLRTEAKGRAVNAIELQDQEAKGGKERDRENICASQAVRHALRHAGIHTPVASIRLQREPFHPKGARAEDFAEGTRFSKHGLWHVEIAFAKPVSGPIVIGNGRYLGLGLMAPVTDDGVRCAVFDIKAAKLPVTARAEVLSALRRALMAQDRDVDKQGQVSTLFSGHESDGAPARDGRHRHVFLAADRCADEQGKYYLNYMYVIRPDHATRSDKQRFATVTQRLRVLHLGARGVLHLNRATSVRINDRVSARSRHWISLTDLHVTRHPKKGDEMETFLKNDVGIELKRRGFPQAEAIKLLKHRMGPNGGVYARFSLHFAVAVEGPLLLGRGAHRGEGLFVAR